MEYRIAAAGDGALGEQCFLELAEYAAALCPEFSNGLVGCYGSGDNIC